jgi:single-strand selective monofunctional uracil DNA glycosylase
MSHAERAALRLREALGDLAFAAPVSHVYNPLDYAWAPHQQYLRRYVSGPKRVLFLGMNAGPFGMVQTGVPFGEIAAVRHWLGIHGPVGRPEPEHDKRPVSGFDCTRSETSGRRLWGLFRERFGEADNFFYEHAVMNYCPLAFLESSGRNRTPEKLPAPERDRLFAVCNEHLRELVGVLRPAWVIGVGVFAARRAELVLAGEAVKVDCILHPSPASPAANRDWAAQATGRLLELGVWS